MTQSSEPPRPIETLVLVLADLLEEGADLFLEGLPTSLETSPGSAWATDRAVWKAAYESDDVAGWVSETSAIYLAESGHLLRAFVMLLRSHRVSLRKTSSSDPLSNGLAMSTGFLITEYQASNGLHESDWSWLRPSTPIGRHFICSMLMEGRGQISEQRPEPSSVSSRSGLTWLSRPRTNAMTLQLRRATSDVG